MNRQSPHMLINDSISSLALDSRATETLCQWQSLPAKESRPRTSARGRSTRGEYNLFENEGALARDEYVWAGVLGTSTR